MSQPSAFEARLTALETRPEAVAADATSARHLAAARDRDLAVKVDANRSAINALGEQTAARFTGHAWWAPSEDTSRWPAPGLRTTSVRAAVVAWLIARSVPVAQGLARFGRTVAGVAAPVAGQSDPARAVRTVGNNDPPQAGHLG